MTRATTIVGAGDATKKPRVVASAGGYAAPMLTLRGPVFTLHPVLALLLCTPGLAACGDDPGVDPGASSGDPGGTNAATDTAVPTGTGDASGPAPSADATSADATTTGATSPDETATQDPTTGVTTDPTDTAATTTDSDGPPPGDCPAPGPGGADVPVPMVVDVTATEITLNGAPWVPRGMIFEAFLVTLADAKACIAKGFETTNGYCQRHIDARDYYFGTGAFACHDALVLAKNNWNVDSIRFNLNQAALDHGSPNFSQAYVDEVHAAITRARARGFVVFAALFSQRNDNGPDYLVGKNPKTELNNASTKAGAQTLANQFGEDRGVIIELLNEPYGVADLETSWGYWLSGGGGYVGANEIITAIRDKDAKNAILLQGLGGDFTGFPGGVVDPKNRIIYSAHPFLTDTAGAKERVDWYSRFGQFANNHPFVITAWDANPGDAWCGQIGVQAAPRFAQYLQQHKWGLVGFAFDVGGSVTKDFRDFYDKPTPYPADCSKGHAGSIVQASFLGALPALANNPPVIAKIDYPMAIQSGGTAQIVVTASDPDNTGGADEPLRVAYRKADQGNGADSPPKYGDTLSWHAPNAKGQQKLTISVIDPYGGRDEKNITITLQ